MKKKPKKGVKNAKPVSKIEQCPSFFILFDPPKVPKDVDVDDNAVSNDEKTFFIAAVFSSQRIHFLASCICVLISLWGGLQAEELQDMMEQDYEIGFVLDPLQTIWVYVPSGYRVSLILCVFCRSTIKDKLIPHAVSWFTGEAGYDDECISEDDDGSEEEDEDHKGEENGHKST